MRYLTLLTAALMFLIGQPNFNMLASTPSNKDKACESSSTHSKSESEPIASYAGAIKCGDKTCDSHKSYCEMIKTDVPTIPNVYACKPLPTSCLANKKGELSPCGCFPPGTRCIFCSTLEQNGTQFLQRTCIGAGAGNQHLQ